ncbi:MAG: extracellular solute-binding protein [Pirellulaceae bacterium]
MANFPTSCRRFALVAALLLPGLLVALSGCDLSPTTGGDAQSDQPKIVTPPPTDPVRLLIIDDAPLAEAIQREWLGHAASPLDVVQKTTAEFETEHILGDAPLDADAVIYPAGLIGELAERELIEPLPESTVDSQELARADLLALLRLHETMWGERMMAAPLGSPQLMLMVRADLLEKLEAQPPQTWQEYQQLAERLADRDALGDAVSSDGPWYGVVEPLGDGWASQMLLARAAPYARRRNRYSTLFDYLSMKPYIDQEPFVRALEELAAAAKLGPKDAVTMTPHDARRELLRGRAAMAVCWPTHALGEGDDALIEAVRFPVRFAELPGSEQVFDFRGAWHSRTDDEDRRVPLLSVAGRMGSVVKDSPRRLTAARVLSWLSSQKENATHEISPSSKATTLYRSSQLGNPPIWIDEALDGGAADSYREVTTQTHLRVTPLFSVRIPGRGRYLAALDEAVHAVIAGEKKADAALREAAAKWEEITDSIGRDMQRDAYQRSLGIEP